MVTIRNKNEKWLSIEVPDYIYDETADVLSIDFDSRDLSEYGDSIYDIDNWWFRSMLEVQQGTVPDPNYRNEGFRLKVCS